MLRVLCLLYGKATATSDALVRVEVVFDRAVIFSYSATVFHLNEAWRGKSMEYSSRQKKQRSGKKRAYEHM